MSSRFFGSISILFALCFLMLGVSNLPQSNSGKAFAKDAGPFNNYNGRWVGNGRIGFKNGKNERIKCRTTYFPSKGGNALVQNLRCVTEGANIDLKSTLTHRAGKVTGTWKESVYNLGGDVSGKVTKKGFTLFVRGDRLTAIMQINTVGDRQIVEIKFENVEVIGVTIILKRG